MVTMTLTPTMSHDSARPISPLVSPSLNGERRTRSRASSRLSFRSIAPSSFYAGLATEPPKAEDFDYGDGSEYSVDAWLSGFRHAFEGASDDLPDSEALRAAGNLPIYDSEGNATPFSEICSGVGGGEMPWGERRLVIFIRHFFCQACESYTRALADSLPYPLPSRDSQLPTSSIILISCGKPSFIKPYVERTKCPFPVYADPCLKLFKALGCRRWAGLKMGKGKEYTGEASGSSIALKTFSLMAKASMTDLYRPNSSASFTSSTTSNSSRRPLCSRSFMHSGDQDVLQNIGSSRPSSIETTTTYTSNSSQDDDLRFGPGPQTKRRRCLHRRLSFDGLRGGPLHQVGGEFLFEDGHLLWCHRMRSIRDHAEIRDIKRVLDLPTEEEDETPMAEPGPVPVGSPEAEATPQWPLKDIDESPNDLAQNHVASEDQLPEEVPLTRSSSGPLPHDANLLACKTNRLSLASITEITMRLQEENKIPRNNASAREEEEEAAYVQSLCWTKAWTGATPRSSMIVQSISTVGGN